MDDEDKLDDAPECNDDGSNRGASPNQESRDPEELDEKQFIAEICNSLRADGTDGVNFQGKAHLVVGNLIVYGGEPPPGGSSQWKHSDKSQDDKKPDDKQEPHEQDGFKNPKPTDDIWLDLTIEMIAPRGIRPHLTQVELTSNFKDLQDNRLIFISCADEQMAKASAYSLIERLDLPDPEQRRLLDFSRIGKNKCVPEITELLQRDGARNALAVVVDLFNPKAEEFFDSLIDSVAHSSDPLWVELRRSRIYLLCVVHAAELCSKLNAFNANEVFAHDRPFPHWRISFLQPLIQYHFPEQYKELQSKILERRTMWHPDDRVFCQQLKASIQDGSLIRILEKPSKADDLPEPQTLFKNEDVLLDTVLYAGTFFTDLKPREFHRVVNVLLGDRTKTFTVSTTRKAENGSSEQVEVEREKLLSELWQESTDRIKAQCSLAASPALDGTTIVSFKSHQLRDELRDYLRSEYAFFLNRQFEQLMNAGLLFDSSIKIATNMIRLAAETAVADPEYLDEWLQSVLDELLILTTLPTPANSTASIVQPLAALDPPEVHLRFCQRLSALIRHMLEAHQLKDTANYVLEQLMRRQLFRKVFDIVRSLRFAADFDEFYWFKQLIERGHDDCRGRVGLYLADRMQNVGARIYQMLRGMDSWIKVDPPPVPSRSGREALCLLIDFCVKNTIYFPPERYGAWPTSHPLFRFADSTAATENLRLLMRWLFHPWMKAIIAARLTEPAVNYSIAILIAEWVFILLRPPEITSKSTYLQQQADIALTPQQVVQILIEQVVQTSDDEQREDLLLCWESWSADLLREIGKMPFADAEGSTRIWKRNLLNDFITQFKICAYDREMLQVAHG